MKHTSLLVLLRHGQSEWNKQNIFTGWVDIPLSAKGLLEAKKAGQDLCQIDFSSVYVSSLMRAKMTACLALQENKLQKIPYLVHQKEQYKDRFAFQKNKLNDEKMLPMIEAWQLNERFYGDLQGQNKDEVRAKYGVDQVKIWRRSFDTSPPNGESLEMTVKRTIPFFHDTIAPQVKQGENILVSAHGNSLRSIVMDLEKMSPSDIVNFEIPTGHPLVYEYKNDSFKRIEL